MIPTIAVNGVQVPAGFFASDGQWLSVPCPCVDVTEEDCAYHGKSPYMFCETCNFGGHTCPGCGDPIDHYGPGVCDGCLQDIEAAKS